MAFFILSSDEGEIARCGLEGPVTIGRSPECEVSVRDIRMSRQHCRIEPVGSGWAVADLGSKNGTLFKGKPIDMRILEEGDRLLVGRTWLKFHAGPLVPAPAGAKPGRSSSARRRPADPREALSDTMVGITLDLFPHQGPARPVGHLPTPAPRPADPDGYAEDGVYSLLTELVSSSWDSIYASNARPAAVRVAGQQPRRPPESAQRKPPPDGAVPPDVGSSVRRESAAAATVTAPATPSSPREQPAVARPRMPRSALEIQAKMQLQADPTEAAAVEPPEAPARARPRPPLPPPPALHADRSRRWLRTAANAGRRVGYFASRVIRLLPPLFLVG